MKKNINKEVVYYTFDNFDKIGGIRHCFSTRVGGVSKGFYSEMNLTFYKGDNYDDVLQNFSLIADAVGFSCEDMVFSDQVHGIKVICVGADDKGKGFSRESDIKKADGLVTNTKNLVLTTFYADCVPLFFYDPLKRVTALSHAGWKGTLNKIGAVTVDIMNRNFGCDPRDIAAGIGPSIGKCCFETDYDVASEFLNFTEYTNYIDHDKISGKYYIDLKAINRYILLDSGVENIECSELCTKCNSDIFYSHRICGNKRGSMAAFMQIIGD